MPGRRHPDAPAVFECLAFKVEAPPGRSPAATAGVVLRAALPRSDWRLRPLHEPTGLFEALPAKPGRARRLGVGTAWNLARRLHDQPAVVFAEPLFTIVDASQQEERMGPGRRARASGTDVDPRTDGRYEWPLQAMKVKDAWALFSGRRPGAGVRVGHPDTGYSLHPEIVGPRLRTDLGYDFEDDDPDARDQLIGGPLRNPGHGTGTASVVMSNEGLPRGSAGPAFVSGTAPASAVVPIRTTKSVVLWSMRRLVKATYSAVAQRCHVISMSLGGLFGGDTLHEAVRHAETQGVIVLGAAGNQVGFVVFPAAFDEVIAVAASTIADEAWAGSSRGPAVDVTAPGHSVYRASTTRGDRRQEDEVYAVERGSGTSFAVAATAGLAALWLSYHGRAALIARYGKGRVAAVFRQLLQHSCRVPRGWDTGNFGAGIVHARRLLEMPLPAMAPAGGLRGLGARAVSTDPTSVEAVVHLLAPAERSAIIQVLARLLQVDEAVLPSAMGRVGAELAFRVGTEASLRRHVTAAALAQAAAQRTRVGSSLDRARRSLAGPRASSRLKEMLR